MVLDHPVLSISPIAALAKQGELSFLGPDGTPRLVPLAPFHAGGPPIVFIHGIGGDPTNQEVMITHAQARGMQVWTMAYDTWATGGSTLARGFASELRRLNGRGVTDMTVVAHSLGSLTFKSTLDQLRGPDGHLTGFTSLRYVSLGAPWGGVSAANVALGAVLGTITPAWVRDLAPNSPYWRAMITTPLAPEVAFYNVGGTWDQFIPFTQGKAMDRNRARMLERARRAVKVPQGTHNSVNWDPRTVAFAFDPDGAPDPGERPGPPVIRHLIRELGAMLGLRRAFQYRDREGVVKGGPLADARGTDNVR